MWCWRRLSKVPWRARRSNQSILKEFSPEYSLEGLMLKLNTLANTLATWCKELTHLKRPWCWERLKAGGEGDDRGWDGWMASQLNGHEFEQTLGVGDGQGGLACCNHGFAKSWTQLGNWTKLNWCEYQWDIHIGKLRFRVRGGARCQAMGSLHNRVKRFYSKKMSTPKLKVFILLRWLIQFI